MKKINDNLYTIINNISAMYFDDIKKVGKLYLDNGGIYTITENDYNELLTNEDKFVDVTNGLYVVAANIAILKKNEYTETYVLCLEGGGELNINENQFNAIKEIEDSGSGGGGTEVIANPEIPEGAEDLSALSVDGTVYKIPEGGGSSDGSVAYIHGKFSIVSESSNMKFELTDDIDTVYTLVTNPSIKEVTLLALIEEYDPDPEYYIFRSYELFRSDDNTYIWIGLSSYNDIFGTHDAKGEIVITIETDEDGVHDVNIDSYVLTNDNIFGEIDRLAGDFSGALFTLNGSATIISNSIQPYVNNLLRILPLTGRGSQKVSISSNPYVPKMINTVMVGEYNTLTLAYYTVDSDYTENTYTAHCTYTNGSINVKLDFIVHFTNDVVDNVSIENYSASKVPSGGGSAGFIDMRFNLSGSGDEIVVELIRPTDPNEIYNKLLENPDALVVCKYENADSEGFVATPNYYHTFIDNYGGHFYLSFILNKKVIPAIAQSYEVEFDFDPDTESGSGGCTLSAYATPISE